MNRTLLDRSWCKIWGQVTNTLGTVGCHNNVVLLGPVVPNTPAANMGLAEEDAIIFVDKTRIADARALDLALTERAGKTVEIRYVRDGQRYKTEGMLGLAPQTKASGDEESSVGLSLVSGAVDAKLADEVKRDSGVFVDGVRYASRACEAGFRTGDLLLSVNDIEIGDLEQAMEAFGGLTGDAKANVMRGGKPMQVDIASASSLESRKRLGIREAAPLRPWQSAEEKSWTWLTVSGLALANAAGAYAQSIRDEQVRIAEYNRRQAAAAASAPNTRVRISSSGRRGSNHVITQSGEIYSVDLRTAKMLQSNPDFYVQSGRRGGMEIYNANGQRVSLNQTQRGMPLPVQNLDWLNSVSYGDPLRQLFGDSSIQRGGTTYGQDYSGSSINNPGWANGPWYDVGDEASWQRAHSTSTGDQYDQRRSR